MHPTTAAALSLFIHLCQRSTSGHMLLSPFPLALNISRKRRSVDRGGHGRCYLPEDSAACSWTTHFSRNGSRSPRKNVKSKFFKFKHIYEETSDDLRRLPDPDYSWHLKVFIIENHLL